MLKNDDDNRVFDRSRSCPGPYWLFPAISLVLIAQVVIGPFKDGSNRNEAGRIVRIGTWQIAKVTPGTTVTSVTLFHRRMGENDTDIVLTRDIWPIDPTYPKWRREQEGDFLVARPTLNGKPALGALGYVEPISLVHGHNTGPVLGL